MFLLLVACFYGYKLSAAAACCLNHKLEGTSVLRAALVVVAGLFLGANAWPAPNCSVEPCRATVRDLVEQPDLFQGKRVIVEGVLDLRFELHGLRHGTLKLSLALFSPDKDSGEFEPEQVAQDGARIEKWRRAGLQGRWVEVLGVFDKKETGHFGMLKHGGLRNVEAIVPKGAQ